MTVTIDHKLVTTSAIAPNTSDAYCRAGGIPMKRVTTIRLDEELDEALTVAAASEYRSISALLNIAARAWLVANGYLEGKCYVVPADDGRPVGSQRTSVPTKRYAQT